MEKSRAERLKQYQLKKSKEELQEYFKFKRRLNKVSPRKGKGSYNRKNQKIDFE